MNNRKIINLLLIFFAIFSWIYSYSILAATDFAIKVPVANMHSKPDGNSDVVSQVIYGSFIKIVENKKDWSSIVTVADNYHGWIKNTDFAAQVPYPSSQMVKVKNFFANVYREPDTTKHQPIFMLPYDARLQAVDATEDSRWYKVNLVGGEEGWIAQGDVVLNPQNLTMKEMLELAHKFVGLPYLWGGISTYGFDCSGLVQALYKQIGVYLPRDSKPQANWNGLVEVNKQNLQPGDILYFGWDNKISHTGIYIGNNLYISATPYKSPVVQIGDLRDPHWRDIYITARRLVWHKQMIPAFNGSVRPISSELKIKMQKYTWRKGCPIAINDLAAVEVSYWGFDDKVHQGALIVKKELASEVLDIFKEIYQYKFPIKKINPIEYYEGQDDLSMRDNNTSAFNCRVKTDYPDQYSVHSYGAAIDINPLINPYVNGDKIDPIEGTEYADRNVYHKGQISIGDVVYQAFTKRGWEWGGSGNWTDGIKDYQHFEKVE